MADISKWSEVASENSADSPDGYPEQMNRSGVNDADRETQAALKREYLDPHFHDQFLGFTLVRNDATTLRIVDGTKADASQHLVAGQRVQVTGADGTKLGFVVSAAYGAPNTTVVVLYDGAAVTPSAPLTVVEVGPKDLERIAYYKTGSTTGENPPEVPTADDLGSAAFKDEADIDAGSVGGFTVDQIFAAALFLGNLAPNPTMTVWSRGETFSVVEAEDRYKNLDGNLTADSYEFLSDGADRAKITKSETAPPGLDDSIRLEVTTVTTSPNAEKVGFLMMMEHRDSASLIDVAGSLPAAISIFCLASAGIQSIGVMALGWSGARDDATGTYPITDWKSGEEDVVPTVGANWSVEANEFFDVSAAWTRLELSSFAFDTANLENIGVFFYLNERDHAAGDTAFFTGLQVELNAQASAFQGAPRSEYLARNARYFMTSFGEGTRPDHGQGLTHALHATANNSGRAVVSAPFPREIMRVPTMAYYNPSDATPGVNYWRDYTNNVNAAVSNDYTNSRQINVTPVGNNNRRYALGYTAKAAVRGNF